MARRPVRRTVKEAHAGKARGDVGALGIHPETTLELALARREEQTAELLRARERTDECERVGAMPSARAGFMFLPMGTGAAAAAPSRYCGPCHPWLAGQFLPRPNFPC